MPLPYDADETLDSLLDELRMVIAALNEVHHPVYPTDPRRIRELEARRDDLREQVQARRRELAAGAPAVAGAAPQAKGPDRVGQQP